MKTRSVFMMMITLVMTSTIAFAQGRRMMSCPAYRIDANQVTCLDVLTNLNETQKEKIKALEVSHQAEMNKLRTNRRSAFSFEDKDKIGEMMTQKVNAHREEVRNLLTDEQKKQYDMLHAQNGNYGRKFINGRNGRSMPTGPGRGGNGRRF